MTVVEGVYPVVKPVSPGDVHRVLERLRSAASDVTGSRCRVSTRRSLVARYAYRVVCSDGLELDILCDDRGCQAVARRGGLVARCAIVCQCVHPVRECEARRGEAIDLAEHAARILALTGLPAESGTMFWRAWP